MPYTDAELRHFARIRCTYVDEKLMPLGRLLILRVTQVNCRITDDTGHLSFIPKNLHPPGTRHGPVRAADPRHIDVALIRDVIHPHPDLVGMSRDHQPVRSITARSERSPGIAGRIVVDLVAERPDVLRPRTLTVGLESRRTRRIQQVDQQLS